MSASADHATLNPRGFAPLFGAHIRPTVRHLTRTERTWWFMAAEVFISYLICAVWLQRAPDHRSVWKSSIIFTAVRVLFITDFMHVNKSERTAVCEEMSGVNYCALGVVRWHLCSEEMTEEQKNLCVNDDVFSLFFFSWGHRVYCLSWEVPHAQQRRRQAGSDVSVFACLLGPAVLPWAVSDSTAKVNKAFKSLIRLNHWTGKEMFHHSLPCTPSKKTNKSFFPPHVWISLGGSAQNWCEMNHFSQSVF